MLTIQFLCPLPNGLHARPAWELKEQCSQWQSEITFINHRQNAKADAKSSLALIGTGTLFNDSCSLNISGSDEEQARRVLEEYIQVRFIDSDSVQPTQAELTAHPLPRSLSRLNPDLLYGNVLASGVGVGTLTLLQSDSLDSYRAIPASAQDSTRLEHSLATLAEQLNQQPAEVWLVASSSEEVGLRGGQTATRAVSPDVAIVLDTACWAKNFDYGAANHRQIGNGPMLVLSDKSLIAPPKLTAWVETVAAEIGVPLQADMFSNGGTDGGAVHLTGTGVPTVVMGPATRHGHCAASIADCRDILQMQQLLSALIQRLTRETVVQLTDFR
ncbi:hypothetical protein EI044_00160 [Escherichia coli]|uniref:HPr family phosphocarrier protein n=1 Tax=Escherichia coli TaxID=562 RepID=UPI00128EAFF7|nr:hypothetical protein [Escherichia coli]